ncbi:DUF742 domain-containing protein [Nocardiopsis dassonvillei]|uniref:DUF742 domain-containing protein n=1 Tax=Nocardiopsis dassonvillei TaxID=2014 RepID=UPI00102C960D|nr:DUF742 domain-containing protein [Nocardiopsis dassonvillei]MCP3017016.1 DUF742 domain-containing protein [Nocardiopsis dassonvillei]
MTHHDSLRAEAPDRLYTVTGGRSDADTRVFDSVTLVVAECDPVPGMQSEHAAILRLCAYPTAVVELSAELRLPVSVVRILLLDLLDTGRVSARHPAALTRQEAGHDPETLKQVLLALQRL